jgi:5'-3' exonuclease
MNKNKRLLIIDALNMYFRAYIVNPSLSSNGDPIGGLMGFLKILQKLIRETKPDGIVICWDGAGGSKKRKSINKKYKAGRKPIRLNRSIRNLSEQEELKNKVWQQTRLVEMLNELPIIQLMLESVEADDIISCVANHKLYDSWQKVIVSSDKDFFQLCDDETIVFRPTQNEVLNKHAIVEKFGIHPTNFALARAIVGDKSDNLDGVPGVGMPTVAKRLPFLKEEKTFTIDDVVEYCKQVEKPVNAHSNIVENTSVIHENYKLMQLYVPSISVQGRRFINETLKDFKPEFNKTGIQAMMIEDGFAAYNWMEMFSIFRSFCYKST